ncbi:S1 RNA-binding domain-containing protein [Candidatus Dojkabacteria bacterium]|uniref:S1 RNA-binding domain-containing protein n=1 Tax=Candidatus Dojkabacteria bacterium TaxID=2099670 RepID=A0A3M0Z0X0_9BACT|nr:MAG: S1 RNA-binding domain-containing protein [Candidatus Dojkabacteria bacterium]
MSAKKKFSSVLELDYKVPKSFKKGDFVEGTVLNVMEDAVIVDVGGRSEGIVMGNHLKLDGKRVDFSVGEKYLFYVLSPENQDGLISLSVKKTGKELKWHRLKYIKDNNLSIKVKVIEANGGGVLVEIFDGIRGFIPSSQLNNDRIFTSQTQTYTGRSDAQRNLQLKLVELIGKEIEVRISEMDKDKGKVILSERMLNSSDYEKKNEFLSKLKIGDRMTGEVTGIAPFGLFVSANGIEGLVHLSEISWDKVVNPGDYYKIGDKVEVEVIGIFDNKKKVAYSIKRTQKDPWEDIVSRYQIGQVVKGVVSSIVDYGVFVRLEEGLNGLVHISELSNKLVKHPSSVVNVGQELEVMIISISNEERHLGLSLKRMMTQTSSLDAQLVEEKREDDDEIAESKTSDKLKSPSGPEMVSVDESGSGREMDTLKKLLGS